MQHDSHYGDYRDRVTVGLLADVLAAFERHGVVPTDPDPWRLARALAAVGQLADALAGPRGGPSGTALDRHGS